MTVAVGCTGGKHRSVAMTEEIARRLGTARPRHRRAHRDLGGSELMAATPPRPPSPSAAVTACPPP